MNDIAVSGAIRRKDVETMRQALEALPDPQQLELLAEWFDIEAWGRGSQPDGQVQDTLRRWAALSRDAAAALNERLLAE